MGIRESVRHWLEGKLDHEQRGLSRLQRFLVTQAKLYVHVAWEITRGEYLQRAAALAFTSLVALIPFLTLTFSIYHALEGLSQTEVKNWATNVIQQYLLGHNVPGSPTSQVRGESEVSSEALNHWGEKVSETIIEVAERASSAHITAAGAVLFILSTLLLFNNIEGALNAIWHVRLRRRLITRFTAFCTILLFVPLLLGVSIYLGALQESLVAALVRLPRLAGVTMRLVLYALPLLVTIGGFFLAYMIIPNTQVRWKPALGGAIIAAILWELAKTGLGIYVSHMVSYRRVYGSLAVVPIFFLWVYLTWLIVLFGAGVAFTSQNLSTLDLARRQARRPSTINPYDAVGLLCLIGRRFLDCQGPVAISELAAATDTAEENVEAALAPLVKAGIVSVTTQSPRKYQPARPVDKVLLAEVLAIIGRANAFPVHGERVPEAVTALFRRLEEIQAEGLGGLTLKDVLEGKGPRRMERLK